MRYASAGGAVTDVTDRRARLVGVVQPYDDERAERALAFIGTTALVPVTNANHQLWNPAASGRNVSVEAVILAWDANLVTAVGVRSTNAAATTLVGTGANRSIGGAASAAELRTQDVAPLGAAMGRLALPPAAGMNTQHLHIPLRLWITPGFGAVLSTEASSLWLRSVTWIWWEI